jgi:hypothetical protein
VPRGNFAAVKNRLPPANYATDVLVPPGHKGKSDKGFGEFSGACCRKVHHILVQPEAYMHAVSKHTLALMSKLLYTLCIKDVFTSYASRQVGLSRSTRPASVIFIVVRCNRQVAFWRVSVMLLSFLFPLLRHGGEGG